MLWVAHLYPYIICVLTRWFAVKQLGTISPAAANHFLLKIFLFKQDTFLSLWSLCSLSVAPLWPLSPSLPHSLSPSLPLSLSPSLPLPLHLHLPSLCACVRVCVCARVRVCMHDVKFGLKRNYFIIIIICYHFAVIISLGNRLFFLLIAEDSYALFIIFSTFCIGGGFIAVAKYQVREFLELLAFALKRIVILVGCKWKPAFSLPQILSPQSPPIKW